MKLLSVFGIALLIALAPAARASAPADFQPRPPHHPHKAYHPHHPHRMHHSPHRRGTHRRRPAPRPHH